jgi:hypothetical protein
MLCGRWYRELQAEVTSEMLPAAVISQDDPVDASGSARCFSSAQNGLLFLPSPIYSIIFKYQNLSTTLKS